jgi:hypothetical protein
MEELSSVLLDLLEPRFEFDLSLYALFLILVPGYDRSVMAVLGAGNIESI